MYIIVGLGNPGSRYEGTRHNMGFDVIDRLIENNRIPQAGRKFHAVYGTGMIGGEKVVLAKPITFMNLSGKSVVACMSFYHLPIGSVLVLHDELDLPLGDLRVKTGGGAGGHNGLKSIIELTGSNDFSRVRIGIGRPEHGDVVNYVLGKFPVESEETLSKVLNIGVEALKTYIASGTQASMRFCFT